MAKSYWGGGSPQGEVAYPRSWFDRLTMSGIDAGMLR